MDKRTGWLKKIKIGDKVLVCNRYYGNEVKIVKKITSTGMLDVDGNRYSHTGLEKGNIDRWSGRNILEEYTIEKEKLRKIMDAVKEE